jgi:hypothetical protein
MTTVCGHLDRITVESLPTSIKGCEECLKIGSRWVHLRICYVDEVAFVWSAR